MDDATLEPDLELPISLADYAKRPRQFQRVRWLPPKFEWIDPLKDRQAEKLAVDSGFKSRSDVVEAEGYDPEENDARIAADHAREEKLGLEFASAIGGAQAQPATDNPNDNQPPTPPNQGTPA